MKDELKALLKSAGADLVGYADMSEVPTEARDGMPYAVSIAVALDPRIISNIRNGPTQDYWEEYKRANARLLELADRAAGFLVEHGQKAKALVPTIINYEPALRLQVSYDTASLSTTLPHKTAATLSGLGWIGKCALLVTREFGSAVRLTTVLTDARLPTGRPIAESRCGNCTACVEACPGHAPSGVKWQAGMPRESFFNAFACRDEAYMQAEKIGVRETLCGICIAACRRTRKYLRKAGYAGTDDR